MEPGVVDNPERSRFEIHEGDGGDVAGFVAYELQGDEIIFLHTEIDARHEGRGLGGRLVRAALDAARDDGLSVLPYCPFVRGWIERHPAYMSLVREEQRSRYGW
ncbi:GNAT family N-acetyltransferase [Streptomyces sp. NPDC048639]|uniref:GNAT family N-acetyltransferase n=1 Tax=Streptomyces sp. NPDC048639 TaxID=3365581 RepID=UPI003720706A